MIASRFGFGALVAAALAAAFSSLACSSDEECTLGSAGCACTSSQACESGLTCTSGQCVAGPSAPGGGGSQPPAGGGGGSPPSGGGGSGPSQPGTGTPPSSAAPVSMEPFVWTELSFAKPAGWTGGLVTRAPDTGGYHKFRFSPPNREALGISHVDVWAMVTGYTGVDHARNRLKGIIAANGLRLIAEGSCCLRTFAHWVMAAVETQDMTPLGRFAIVLATANTLTLQPSAQATDSVVIVTGSSLERLTALDAEFLALNIGQTVNPPNDLPASILHGKWESMAGAYLWSEVGPNLVANTSEWGEYRLYTFRPDGSYHTQSGYAASGEGYAVKGAIRIEQTGRYQAQAGVLTMSREHCELQEYTESNMLKGRQPCGSDYTPLALRLERAPAGNVIALSGVAIPPILRSEPRVIYPKRK